MTNPIMSQVFYRSARPAIGKYTIQVWHSEAKPGKYSFSCFYGRFGYLAKCDYPKDAPYQFGWFDTPESALLAGKKTVFKDAFTITD